MVRPGNDKTGPPARSVFIRATLGGTRPCKRRKGPKKQSFRITAAGVRQRPPGKTECLRGSLAMPSGMPLLGPPRPSVIGNRTPAMQRKARRFLRPFQEPLSLCGLGFTTTGFRSEIAGLELSETTIPSSADKPLPATRVQEPFMARIEENEVRPRGQEWQAPIRRLGRPWPDSSPYGDVTPSCKIWKTAAPGARQGSVARLRAGTLRYGRPCPMLPEAPLDFPETGSVEKDLQCRQKDGRCGAYRCMLLIFMSCVR